MLINIKKTMTILSTLLLGIMCSFCSDTIDVYAGQYGEEDGTSEPETPEVTGNIVPIESLRNPPCPWDCAALYCLSASIRSLPHWARAFLQGLTQSKAPALMR